jgi:hypothetical protein
MGGSVALPSAFARILGRAALLCVLLCALAAPAALADTQRVSGRADPDAHGVQARRQALESAFVEAVMLECRRLLPAPLPEARQNALRQHLAPRAVGYVVSYQEVSHPQEQTEEPAVQAQQAGHSAASGELTLDVDVNAKTLRADLVRLGLFAGIGRTRPCKVGFGQGVSERDFRALDGLSVLLGLNRASQAPLEVTLERLPQGYYKAVLRGEGQSLAADAGSLPDLWLAVWGRFYGGLESQSAVQSAAGPGLAARGFASVDGVHEFSRVLTGWDDAVQGAVLQTVELGNGEIVARWTLRVVNQARLDAHLREYLPGRGFTVSQGGLAQQSEPPAGRQPK